MMKTLQLYLSLCLVSFWGCSDNVGVIPPGGTDETKVDPAAIAKEEAEKRIDPNAERLSLPKVDFRNSEAFPVQVQNMFPIRKRGTAVKIVGEGVHPSPESLGAGVFVKFWPDGQDEVNVKHVIQGGTHELTGTPTGEWSYELDGNLPPQPGRYGVRVEMFHLKVDPNVMELPTKDRVTTTVVMKGEVTVE